MIDGGEKHKRSLNFFLKLRTRVIAKCGSVREEKLVDDNVTTCDKKRFVSLGFNFKFQTKKN